MKKTSAPPLLSSRSTRGSCEGQKLPCCVRTLAWVRHLGVGQEQVTRLPGNSVLKWRIFLIILAFAQQSLLKSSYCSSLPLTETTTNHSAKVRLQSAVKQRTYCWPSWPCEALSLFLNLWYPCTDYHLWRSSFLPGWSDCFSPIKGRLSNSDRKVLRTESLLTYLYFYAMPAFSLVSFLSVLLQSDGKEMAASFFLFQEGRKIWRCSWVGCGLYHQSGL